MTIPSANWRLMSFDNPREATLHGVYRMVCFEGMVCFSWCFESESSRQTKSCHFDDGIWRFHEVSWSFHSHGGTPKWSKWMVYNGKTYINGWFWGTPIHGTPPYIYHASLLEFKTPCNGQSWICSTSQVVSWRPLDTLFPWSRGALTKGVWLVVWNNNPK